MKLVRGGLTSAADAHLRADGVVVPGDPLVDLRLGLERDRNERLCEGTTRKSAVVK